MNTSTSLLMTSLQLECPNRAGQVIGGRSTTEKGPSETSSEQSDFGAVVYIVVVLIFYSAGVLIMIIRYLKTEKKELEEEATLENFFKYMPDKKKEQEHRVNRVAIHAFHTLTSFSYDDEEFEDMEMGSDKPSPQPLLVTDV